MEQGSVAPHENREVELVLGGLKPLASVEHDKDPETYVKAILLGLAGMLTYTVSPTMDSKSGEVVFALPSNKHLLETYKRLLKGGIDAVGAEVYHRSMGKLFGYSDADVDAFLASSLECNCEKCTGRKA